MRRRYLKRNDPLELWYCVQPLVRPLRLLTIAHSYAVALNRRLAREFARAGHGRWEVTCVAPEFFRGDLRPVTLEREPGEPFELVPTSAHLTRKAHVFFYGRSLRRLMKRDWDVIHGWEEPYVLAGYQLARWANPRARYVFWTAQNISKRYPPPFAQFERRVLARADGWLYCGESVRSALSARPGYGALPALPAPLGVDVDLFTPDRARRVRWLEGLGWSEQGPPVVGYMGRFVEEKGVSLFLRALSGAKVPFRALFVGGGPLEAEIRSFGARFPDRVRVVRAKHDEVPGYLNAMDLLCAPSQTTPRWREQFGRMLTEAMASGVPVAGSDSGEIPFVIGDAGVVLPERDVEAWRGAIVALLGDPERRAELAERGRARVMERYQWPVVARKQLEFFSRLLDGARA
jgi:glycosyltransferase involved in cell wall biosynthesis